jgi:hypothetical protein
MSRTAYRAETKEIARQAIMRALQLSTSVRVDQLDCSVSWCRQPTEKSVSEIIEIWENSKGVFNCIFRDLKSFMPESESYWDVGLSTFGPISYFLWIELKPEDGDQLVKEFDLKEID